MENHQDKRKLGRKKPSYAWAYFTPLNKSEDRAMCKICNAVLSYRGSVSNLGKHLASRHPFEFKTRHLIMRQQMENPVSSNKIVKVKGINIPADSFKNDANILSRNNTQDSFENNDYSDYDESELSLEEDNRRSIICDDNEDLEEYAVTSISPTDPLHSKTDNIEDDYEQEKQLLPSISEKRNAREPSQYQLLKMNNLFLKAMAEAQGFDVTHIEEIAYQSRTETESDHPLIAKLGGFLNTVDDKLNKSSQSEALSLFINQQMSRISDQKLFQSIQFKLLQIMHQGNIDQLTLDAKNADDRNN